MKESPTQVFNIPAANADAIYKYYMGLYNCGIPDVTYG
jgi:hypothetical protein